MDTKIIVSIVEPLWPYIGFVLGISMATKIISLLAKDIDRMLSPNSPPPTNATPPANQIPLGQINKCRSCRKVMPVADDFCAYCGERQ